MPLSSPEPLIQVMFIMLRLVSSESKNTFKQNSGQALPWKVGSNRKQIFKNILSKFHIIIIYIYVHNVVNTMYTMCNNQIKVLELFNISNSLSAWHYLMVTGHLCVFSFLVPCGLHTNTLRCIVYTVVVFCSEPFQKSPPSFHIPCLPITLWHLRWRHISATPTPRIWSETNLRVMLSTFLGSVP